MARYVLIPKHSDKVLDVDNRAAGNGAQVQQWDWLGGVNQRWLLALTRVDPARAPRAPTPRVAVIAKHSGKVLDVVNRLGRNGAQLQQWDWNGGAHQEFRLELIENDFFGARYRLIAVHSGKVLEVPGSSGANGVRLQQWDWVGGDNQKFRVEPAGGSNLLHYRLVAVHSGKVLEVSGNSGADGAPLLQWDWHGGDNQRWLLAGRY